MDEAAFLQRVRGALRSGRLPEFPDPAPRSAPPDPVDLEEEFRRRCEAVDGTVHIGEDPVEVVVSIARRLDTRDYLGWEPEHLPVAGIVDRLERRGLVRRAVGGDLSEVADVPMGVTGASAGLAESGSVVLETGPGRPRAVSLLPDVHVVLLPRARLYRSLTHWVEERAHEVAATSNLVIVTGPSRTADIEQQLNLGVHGPREVQVVLV